MKKDINAVFEELRLEESFQIRKKAAERFDVLSSQLAESQSELAKLKDGIPHLENKIINYIMKGKNPDNLREKLDGIHRQIPEIEARIFELENVVGLARKALTEINEGLKTLIQERTQPLYELYRQRVTGLVVKACDLAESWIPSLTEIYEQAGLPLKHAPFYIPYLLDFEHKIAERMKRLYK